MRFAKSNKSVTGILLGIGFLSLIIGIVAAIHKKRAKYAYSEINEDTYYYDDDNWGEKDMKTVVVKNQKIVYAILVAIILISGVIGAVLLVKNQEKTQGYVTTKARVVGYKERMEYDYDEHRDKYMYQEIV